MPGGLCWGFFVRGSLVGIFYMYQLFDGVTFGGLVD